ncbi:MAG: diguanylate cyclase [Verrucomicrobia bacterium]|nr:diguanylate cyclase [Verrucomicrobiota bacterium]
MSNAPAHILIVEDGKTEAFVLTRLLERHGYRVSAAGSGREALEIIERQPVCLVVSDIDMPEMNGYDMCRAIKQHPRHRTTPVILLTTLSSTANILAGLAAKADFYLTKPYEPPYLLERIETLLKRPPAPPDADSEPLPVIIEGREHLVTAGRQQMLNLLLPTYESAVQQNRKLIATQLELNAANAKLAELAVTDGLTGLMNHRAFKERLAEEFQRAARYQLPFAMLLLDVDYFKSFNDTFGHPAGDEVLREVSRLIHTNIRDTDFAARYGGEEFVVLTPFTQRADALALAERVRAAIAGAPWKQRPVTASIGVACLDAKTKTFGELISAADAALYQSKQAGRNRVTG